MEGRCVYCAAKATKKCGIGLASCSECAQELLLSNAKTINRRRRWLIRYYGRKYRFIHGQLAALRAGMARATVPLGGTTPGPALTALTARTQYRQRPPRTPRGVTYDARCPKPFLARYQVKEVKHREYFATVEEAVAWLKSNNPNYGKRP
jgi:hypothetical protein